MTAHQATCVAIQGRGVLIEGPSGSGKSSLALALIDRGARLVGDDGVLLSVAAGRLHAHPHPNTRGLLEVRNLGLLPFPAVDEAPVCLVIRLDASAPRFIEAPVTTDYLGIAVPSLAIWPDPASAVLKVEHALRHYGLPV